MTLLVPDVGEEIIMENFLNKTAPQDLVLKLYSSDTTPSESDTAATYTETTGGGYSDETLIPANWVITAGNPTSGVYTEVVFAFTGAVGNVYGYYVVQSISGDLMWAERFTSGPFNIQNAGDEIKVTPQITLE